MKDDSGSIPPRVSVLIPTHNRATYLYHALRSACAQTYSDIEILVLDDASSDDTGAVIGEFIRDPRVRYVRHSHNLGIAGNWRFGVELARGDFFCLLHDDDTLECDFIARLIEPLQNDPELILAFCDHWMMDSLGRRLPRATRQSSRAFKREGLKSGLVSGFAVVALVQQSVPVGATMFRRRMIPPEFIVQEARGSIDAWLLYQCVKTGQNAYYVSHRLMNYRVHSGAMTAAAPLAMLEGDLFRYRSILDDRHMAVIHGAIRQRLAQTLTKYAHCLLLNDRYYESIASVSESLRLQPSLRGVLLAALALAGRSGSAATRALRRLRRVTVR